jgi:hypothetical protein
LQTKVLTNIACQTSSAAAAAEEEEEEEEEERLFAPLHTEVNG